MMMMIYSPPGISTSGYLNVRGIPLISYTVLVKGVQKLNRLKCYKGSFISRELTIL